VAINPKIVQSESEKRTPCPLASPYLQFHSLVASFLNMCFHVIHIRHLALKGLREENLTGRNCKGFYFCGFYHKLGYRKEISQSGKFDNISCLQSNSLRTRLELKSTASGGLTWVGIKAN